MTDECTCRNAVFNLLLQYLCVNYHVACFFHLNFPLLSFSGAVIECKTMMHYTPLLAAIRYTKPQSVRMLLSRGADMMVADSRRNYNAILWAVEIQNPDILKV